VRFAPRIIRRATKTYRDGNTQIDDTVFTTGELLVADYIGSCDREGTADYRIKIRALAENGIFTCLSSPPAKCC